MYWWARESLVGIKAPSLSFTSTSPPCVCACFFFFLISGVACVFVWERQECAFVLLRHRGLVSPHNASAATVDLGAGGTLLPGQRGFICLWQDSDPQSHTGQDTRVRSWVMWGWGRSTEVMHRWKMQNVNYQIGRLFLDGLLADVTD